MSILDELSRSVRNGNRVKAKELTQRALDEACPPGEIINEGFITGMKEIGELFGKGEVYLPEVLMAARAMKESMALVLPILSESSYEYVARFAIGTVKGDIHDIGKNIVSAVFQGSGFKVEDLGVDIPPQKFIQAIEQGTTIIGMSALIGPTMDSMRVAIEAIEAAGLRSRVKIIVGGPLITPDFAERIRADAYATDAFDGVKKAKELLAASSIRPPVGS
jgi:5-methyltetrahydrofolate--homocysteine methyltransferase